MFLVPKNVEELRRLAESDIPVLAFAFKRRAAEDWAPEHSHTRGQFFALTRGLLVVEAGSERWMFPSQRCAWIPPDCMHKARSVGSATGSLVYLSAEMCRGLPRTPCLFSASGLLFAIVQRGSASSQFFVMRLRSLNHSLCVCLYPGTRGWRELLRLCWMMLATTEGWTTGRILRVCPAVLSCARFPLR
jgi:mannose-6-phosphate isomerase-like protein (cupin superfamily)